MRALMPGLSCESRLKSRALRRFMRIPGLEARILGPGLVGPAVLGIVPLHIAHDIAPRAAPETGQVTRELDRLAARRCQLEQERLRRLSERWMPIEPEQRLDADLDRRSALVLVVDRVMGAGRADEFGRRQAIEGLTVF